MIFFSFYFRALIVEKKEKLSLVESKTRESKLTLYIILFLKILALVNFFLSQLFFETIYL